MKHHHLLAILGSVVLLGGLAAGGYFLWRWLTPPESVLLPVDVHGAQQRPSNELVPRLPFSDITAAAGIRFRHSNGATREKLLPETMSGGVAVLDFDNDGWQDLLFVNSCEWPDVGRIANPSYPVLYRNRGDGTFEDVTEAASLKLTFYGM